MAPKALILAIGMILTAAPLSAAQDEPTQPAAPAGTAETRYCMKVDPLTGSNIETVRCWTREKWADQGVDVDKEWTKDGVRVIG